MKPNEAMVYQEIKVHCSCGNTFITRSSIESPLQIEVCAHCHPFYTGKQKTHDPMKRIERFNNRYAKK